jgi:dihydroflavonol-4-reductase
MGRVLVTGGTGFIGSHLVEHLVAAGDEVRVFVRDANCRPWPSSAGVEVVRGDVADSDSGALDAALVGTETVYHVAGRTLSLAKAGFDRVNHAGTRNVAAACARRTSPPVLVAVSSLAAAGPSAPGRPRVESDCPAPVSDYGLSKLHGEQALQTYAARVPVTIIRPPGVFGPRDRYILPLFQMAWRGWCMTVATGTLEVSLLEVHDLAIGLRLAAARGSRLSASPDESAAGIYFLAQPERPTLDELAGLVAKALDRPLPRVIHVPVPMIVGVAAAAELGARLRRRPSFLCFDKLREARAGCWTCSPGRAELELGARARLSLGEGLHQTGIWYAEHGWIKRGAVARGQLQRGESSGACEPDQRRADPG